MFVFWCVLQVECLACYKFIQPVEGVQCSHHGCQGVYHRECAKGSFGFSTIKKFKCPHHVKFSSILILCLFCFMFLVCVSSCFINYLCK